MKTAPAARQAARAWALARGLEVPEAARAAGYCEGGSYPGQLAKDEKFRKRVNALRELYQLTGSFEPAPLVMELLATAEKSRRPGQRGGHERRRRHLCRGRTPHRRAESARPPG